MNRPTMIGAAVMEETEYFPKNEDTFFAPVKKFFSKPLNVVLFAAGAYGLAKVAKIIK